jgi:hypothetical protein
VIAAGGCTIRWQGEDYPASTPRVTDFAEAADAFHPFQHAVLRVAGVGAVLRLQRDVSED